VRRLPASLRGREVLPPFLLGLALRVWQIDLTRFDFENSVLWRTAVDFVARGVVPLTSGLRFGTGTIDQTLGSGIWHPPLTAFLLSVPALVSREPAWMAGFLAAVDAAGTLFVYAALRGLAGRWPAFAGACLYGLSPAAIFYSRMIWNPQLVPFFSAVGLWATLEYARRGDGRHLAVAAFAVACAAQLHLSSAALFVPLGVLAVRGWRTLDWRPLAASAAVLFALLAPYLVLQVQTDGADLRAMLAYAAAPKELRPETGFIGLSLLGGDLHRQVQTWWPDPDPSLFREPGLWLTLVMISVGVAAAWRRPAAWLLVAWLLVPLAAGLRGIQGVYPHYFLTIVPAGAALAGLGLGTLRPRVLGIAALACLAALRLLDYAAFIDDAAALRLTWIYDVPLRYTQQAAHIALADAGSGPLLVGGRGHEAFTMASLIRDRRPLRVFDSTSTLLLQSGARYLVRTEGRGFDILKREIGAPEATVNAADGTPLYALFAPSAQEIAALDAGFDPIDVRFGDVLAVQGYRPAPLAAGRTDAVIFRWNPLTAFGSQWWDTRVFGHLLDSEGRQWSTTGDAYAALVGDWGPGDTLLYWQAIAPRADAPLGGYWLEIGFYRFGAAGFEHLPAYHGEQSLGGQVRLGPFRVAGRAPAEAPSLATFADEIGLTGVRVEGNEIRLTWRAMTRPGGDYTVFVQGLDADGRVVAQHDGPPVGGSFPTHLWQAGDVVEDVHVLGGNPAAARVLAVGLYTPATLQRLAATVPGTSARSDAYTRAWP
jgi:hypothetical protein